MKTPSGKWLSAKDLSNLTFSSFDRSQKKRLLKKLNIPAGLKTGNIKVKKDDFFAWFNGLRAEFVFRYWDSFMELYYEEKMCPVIHL